MGAVEVFFEFIGGDEGLFAEEVGEFVGLVLGFGVVLLEGRLEGGDLLADGEELLLAGVEVVFGEVLEDVGADEHDEVANPLAAGGVVVGEGVEDDGAVDVDVLAEGVVLEGVARVDHRRRHVLLLLLRLLPEERLVVLEVLQRRLYPQVHLVPQQLDQPPVQPQLLRPPQVPLLQHRVVRLLLLEPHLDQHPNLVQLQLLLIGALGRRGYQHLRRIRGVSLGRSNQGTLVGVNFLQQLVLLGVVEYFNFFLGCCWVAWWLGGV